jgi:sodium/hydrogen antiporter
MTLFKGEGEDADQAGRFRQETEDDSLQPTIDMLLNISVFLWFGAVCPWSSFRDNSVIPIWRLILLGILILLFRRIPVVFAMHKKIAQIEQFQQAAFVGFFGPIGVSAIFYLYVSIDFLHQVTVDGVIREDAAHLEEIMRVVIWFLAICSIVVHGLSIPLGKLGYHLPRTMSQALSSESEPDIHLGHRRDHRSTSQLRPRVGRTSKDRDRRPSTGAFMIGQGQPRINTLDMESAQEPARPVRFIEDTPSAGSPVSSSPAEGQIPGDLKAGIPRRSTDLSRKTELETTNMAVAGKDSAEMV